MQTLRLKTSSTRPKAPSSDGARRARPVRGDLAPLLAGAATAVGAAGALLALVGSDSPLRGPLTLFFLLAAPAAAIATALRGLDPFGRTLVSLAGAVAVDMLVAQSMLALHLWSATGGIVAVTALSALILLLVEVRRPRGRTERRRTP
ncbi:hypothetical protein [Streptomyces sp. NPDC048002]|uniref:hypothetical protein n=1 Tax=unclassified Streptomyces TaxID=2593676 RepID=UPI0033E8955D